GMEGIAVRIVSMPCTDLFDDQNETYRSEVLPEEITCRLAIEAGISDYWWRYVGLSGDVIGIDCFGLSAPANQLFEHFGFSVKNIVERSKMLIKLNIN
ncbi:MAG TPA: transketolase C-terminal domain-containing protein, partial [Woeseiaceae bacterium]|nr:transketolase C-terminal domain-containing protein [Woeseiaceae bacterium]